MRRWIWFAVFALAACKPKEPEYRRMQLPGFSLEVPDFFDGKPRPLDYREDNLAAQDGLWVMSVTWDQGEILTVTELPATVSMVMAELVKDQKLELGPARELKIGGQTATRVDGNVGILEMTFVDVTCGGRSVMIEVVAPRVEAMRDRVLGSFECKPDPAEEQQLGKAVPIGVDDPATLAGFRMIEKATSPLSISNGEISGIFESTSGDAEDLELLRKLMPKLFGVSSNLAMDPKTRETRGTGARERSFEHGSMTLDDGTKRVAISSLWRCEGSNKKAVLALALVETEAESAKAIDWLMKIRCSRAGDPELPVLPFADTEEPAVPEPPAKPEKPAKPVKPAKPKQPK